MASAPSSANVAMGARDVRVEGRRLVPSVASGRRLATCAVCDRAVRCPSKHDARPRKRSSAISSGSGATRSSAISAVVSKETVGDSRTLRRVHLHATAYVLPVGLCEGSGESRQTVTLEQSVARGRMGGAATGTTCMKDGARAWELGARSHCHERRPCGASHRWCSHAHENDGGTRLRTGVPAGRSPNTTVFSKSWIDSIR